MTRYTSPVEVSFEDLDSGWYVKAEYEDTGGRYEDPIYVGVCETEDGEYLSPHDHAWTDPEIDRITCAAWERARDKMTRD